MLNLLLGRIGVSALLLCGVYRDKIINVLCVPAPRSVSIRLLTQRQEEGWKGGREGAREGGRDGGLDEEFVSWHIL